MDIHALIQQANKAGGAGRGPKTSFWRPKSDGVTPLRLYRFGEKKELYENRDIHWVDGRPYACMGEGCPYCESVKRLYDAKDEDSRQRANGLRKQTQFCMVLVNPSQPDGFILWETSASSGRDIVLAIAQVAGWIEGWPKADNPSKIDEFLVFFGRGCDEVCGPKGYDMLVNYQKGRKPSVTVSFARNKGKELAIAEENVPVPSQVRASIDAAVQRKREKQDAEIRRALLPGEALPS